MMVPDATVLRSLPLFAGVSTSDLGSIIGRATSRRYPAGSPVFEQGAEALQFWVLTHGRLRVTQLTAGGDQVVMRVVNPGELCGIARAMGRTTYPATAIAAVESIALGWPMQLWDEMVGQFPAFAASALGAIGSRLQEAHARIREMSTEVVERRVAHAVLRLVQQSGKRDHDAIQIDFPLSKQDLAEMTGTTMFTVSRILSAWEDAGLVDTGRQRLTVRDPHRLLLIADGLERGLLG